MIFILFLRSQLNIRHKRTFLFLIFDENSLFFFIFWSRFSINLISNAPLVDSWDQLYTLSLGRSYRAVIWTTARKVFVHTNRGNTIHSHIHNVACHLYIWATIQKINCQWFQRSIDLTEIVLNKFAGEFIQIEQVVIVQVK